MLILLPGRSLLPSVPVISIEIRKLISIEGSPEFPPSLHGTFISTFQGCCYSHIQCVPQSQGERSNPWVLIGDIVKVG